MKDAKYSEIGLEELKQKESSLKTVVTVFAVMVVLLFLIGIYLTFKQGFSVFSVFPIVILAAFVPSLSNLKSIQTEIARRNKLA